MLSYSINLFLLVENFNYNNCHFLNIGAHFIEFTISTRACINVENFFEVRIHKFYLYVGHVSKLFVSFVLYL